MRPPKLTPGAVEKALTPKQVLALVVWFFYMHPPLTYAQAAARAEDWFGVRFSESALKRFYDRADKRLRWRERKRRDARERRAATARRFFNRICRASSPPILAHARPRGGYVSTITKGLSPEQQTELERWLFDVQPPLLCSQAVARVREQWSVDISQSAVRRFYRRHLKRREFKQSIYG